MLENQKDSADSQGVENAAEAARKLFNEANKQNKVEPSLPGLPRPSTDGKSITVVPPVNRAPEHPVQKREPETEKPQPTGLSSGELTNWFKGGVGVGLYMKPNFMSMPMDAAMKSEVISLSNKMTGLWATELRAATVQMEAIAKIHPIGGTPAQWSESARTVLDFGRFAHNNPKYYPLTGAEHVARDHFIQLHNQASWGTAEHGVFGTPRNPPGGQKIVEASAGKYMLSEVRASHAVGELKQGVADWNKLATTHNEKLGALRDAAAFNEVGSFGLSQIGNYALDNTAFAGIEKSTRTNLIDIGGAAMFLLPYGHPLLRAGAVVALHCGARLLDRYEQLNK